MTHTTLAHTCAKRSLSRRMLSVALGLLPSACFVDADNPCRDNEVLDETAYVCACPSNYALTPDGCVKCGKHEVPSGAMCACEEGYAKADPESACKKVEAPPPAPPPADTGDAGGAPAASSESGEPAAPAKLSAEGEGTACTADDQCSAFPDAKSCDAFVMACSIKNCTIEPDNCPDEYACCDVTAFAPGAPNVCIKGGCPSF